MQFENYRPRPPQPEPKAKRERKPRSKGRAWFLLFILVFCLAILIGQEVKTSYYQSKYIHQYAKTLTYELKNEPTQPAVSLGNYVAISDQYIVATYCSHDAHRRDHNLDR